jgi:GTP-binding protein LepA
MSGKIRNFSIIAHIDHGKSTLSDRILELTKTIENRKMKDQILDRMDLERERGITIKMQPVTVHYKGHALNLIDTPGHVDFSYEVSRSLAAVEAALLLVDASQGIQAQTLANLYLAMEQDLVIIPVLNKIDLPAADVEGTKKELSQLLGCPEEEILLASGKTGEGVEGVLDAIIKRTPPPRIGNGAKDNLRSLIFDSNYDEYRGVVAYIRIVDGELKAKDKVKLLATGAETEALDVGVFSPDYKSTGKLEAGEVGYVVTNLKEVAECKIGDTLTLVKQFRQVEQLHGYEDVKPMVFAGIFPRRGDDLNTLRDAMERLKLNDASLMYEPEYSQSLGFGFRCGFLGILHLEIIAERLKREYDLELLITIPSVAYRVYKKNSEEPIWVRTPQQLPDPNELEKIEEPWVKLEIIVPRSYMGGIMELAQSKRGMYKNTEYIFTPLNKTDDLTGFTYIGENADPRVILHYSMPMAAILTDFYEKVKSISSGYASINYDFSEYKEADVVKLDILVAEEKVEALSTIVYKDEAFQEGKKIVKILKETLDRQMFELKLQAALGGKVIAAERLPALRKDVTAKLYGGDVSRKRKLLEKQKEGKKKMMQSGRGKVDIPPEAFVKILKR